MTVTTSVVGKFARKSLVKQYGHLSGLHTKITKVHEKCGSFSCVLRVYVQIFGAHGYK